MDDLNDLKNFLDEIENEDSSKEKLKLIKNNSKRFSNNHLSSAQKFILSLMMFLFVSVTGFLILLISGRMVLLP